MDDHGCSYAGDAGDQHHRDARGHARQVPETPARPGKSGWKAKSIPQARRLPKKSRRDRDALRIAGRRDPAVEQPVPLVSRSEQRRGRRRRWARPARPARTSMPPARIPAGTTTSRTKSAARGRIARPVQPLQGAQGDLSDQRRSPALVRASVVTPPSKQSGRWSAGPSRQDHRDTLPSARRSIAFRCVQMGFWLRNLAGYSICSSGLIRETEARNHAENHHRSRACKRRERQDFYRALDNARRPVGRFTSCRAWPCARP